MNPIVETALKLLAQYPHAPAIEILDQAMKGHEGTHPDFESYDPVTGRKPHPAYSDDTDAFSPFGELLRRAFGPGIDPRELMLINPIDPIRDESISGRQQKIIDQWQGVIDRFADRYRLWS